MVRSNKRSIDANQSSSLSGTDQEVDTRTPPALLPYLGNLITDQSGLSEDAEADTAGEAARIPRSGSTGSIQAITTRMLDSSSDSSSSAAVNPGNPAKFEAQIRELVETERSYVRRLDALYNRYAKPLRQKARNREGAIIPLYEAQRLFGNVGELLGANTAFLREMDEMMAMDSSMETLKSHIGTVFYKHVSTESARKWYAHNLIISSPPRCQMACFGCYNDYFGNFEKAKHIEQSMTRNNKLFRDFSDAMKMTSPNLGNVSIRELIMEPVQRIPRYKMLLDGLIKSMPGAYLNQKARLEDAVALCGRIASCEIDEKTQRAAVLWSFGRNIHGFPVSRWANKSYLLPERLTFLLIHRRAYSRFIASSSMPSTWKTSQSRIMLFLQRCSRLPLQPRRLAPFTALSSSSTIRCS